jgi:hypothetical protein
MCYRFIKIIFGQVTQNTSRIAYHAKHAVISTIGEPIYQRLVNQYIKSYQRLVNQYIKSYQRLVNQYMNNECVLCILVRDAPAWLPADDN